MLLFDIELSELLFEILLDNIILDINPILVVFFANVFSHSRDCLFILLMVFFAVQNFLSLIRSHLFISAFVSCALGDRSKKYIAMIYVKECSSSVFS